jgi:hypothetical protein
MLYEMLALTRVDDILRSAAQVGILEKKSPTLLLQFLKRLNKLISRLVSFYEMHLGTSGLSV